MTLKFPWKVADLFIKTRTSLYDLDCPIFPFISYGNTLFFIVQRRISWATITFSSHIFFNTPLIKKKFIITATSQVTGSHSPVTTHDTASSALRETNTPHTKHSTQQGEIHWDIKLSTATRRQDYMKWRREER